MDHPRVIELGRDRVTVADPVTGALASATVSDRVGSWTLMAIVSDDNGERVAVFEDHTVENGPLVYVNTTGPVLTLAKRLQPTHSCPSGAYLGRSLDDVQMDPLDVLGTTILEGSEDPWYEVIASCLPPVSVLRDMYGIPTHVTFVGTPHCIDKVGLFYGGNDDRFNPAAWSAEIGAVIAKNHIEEGLVGGWLPFVCYQYPTDDGGRWEIIILADWQPPTCWIQPTWRRLVRRSSGEITRVNYLGSYTPYGRRRGAEASDFYRAMLQAARGWTSQFEGSMRVDLPEEWLADFCRHSLAREMMTRIGDHPKYGVFDRTYGGWEHDGFQDIFNTSTTAMLEWGLFNRAGRYIDNYFREFVCNDGSIKYRGPEIGQYGRMLTVLAQYYDFTGDRKLLLEHRRKIEAIVELLLDLREQAKRIAEDDAAYGMIVGWSEADACLEDEPDLYMQPYFSNSTEACRGFHDLGQAWTSIGQAENLWEMITMGRTLLAEADELSHDIQMAVKRSILTDTQPLCLPCIAGAERPYDVELENDIWSPQRRIYRVFSEMLHSGILDKTTVQMILNYQSKHYGSFLGLPATRFRWLDIRRVNPLRDLRGGERWRQFFPFLSLGRAYGLIQHDLIREFLLLYYAFIAHGHTRGTWTAHEMSSVDRENGHFGPYCTVAQVIGPILTKWMLVFEQYGGKALWLCRATPRRWLEDGSRISVQDAPTRWGKVSFEVISRVKKGVLEANIALPSGIADTEVNLRCRLPRGYAMEAVDIDGKLWDDFDRLSETVSLPQRLSGRAHVEVMVNQSL